ncbi:MAG TPA: hypothetical protein PLK94_08165 [Alphaproteobacteria bacterium]|nr:hypothetical protein [Alphaproteobacteria bacterium]HOO51243.1 hypothetical protein [Alphaproteobacteria bacterium]
MSLGSEYSKSISGKIDLSPLTACALLEGAITAIHKKISEACTNYPQVKTLQTQKKFWEAIGFDARAILSHNRTPEYFEKRFGDKAPVSKDTIDQIVTRVNDWGRKLSQEGQWDAINYHGMMALVNLSLTPVMQFMAEGYSADQAARATLREVLDSYKHYDPQPKTPR